MTSKPMQQNHLAPNGPVSLQAVRPETAAAFLALVQELNASEGIDTPLTEMEPALNRLIHSAELGRAWFIHHQGSAIGYAMLTFGFDLEYGGRDSWLTDIYVRPEFQRRGFARLALELIEEQARSAGVGAIHLMVRPENIGAQSLYLKSGFTQSPRLPMTKMLNPNLKVCEKR